jgi:DNA invertase Pin-like site-specific DNA recombinase
MARIAGHVRTSLDERSSNDERQRETIERWASQHGHVVVSWYIDRGGRRSDADVPGKRQQFKQMMADRDSGRWDIIAVEESSRFGTKDPYQFDHFVYLLNESGIQLWDAGANHLMNPPPDEEGQVIQNFVRKMADRREDVTKSSRAIGGKLAAAKRGRFQGGPLLCCSAIECHGPAGNLLWTAEVVEGRVVQTYPNGRREIREHAPADRNREDHVRLVPSLDAVKRQCVKTVFEMFDAGHGTPAIARRLNAQAILTDYGKLWTPVQVRSILKRGIHFTGRDAFGKVRAGKYHRRKGDRYEKVPAYGKNGKENVPYTEWLMGPQQEYEPVISWELWERCQARLADRQMTAKAPKNPELYLAGLVVCGGCGKKMTGWSTKRDGLRYKCSTYTELGKGHGHNNSFRQFQVEPLIARYLEETGQTLQGIREGDWLGQVFAERGQALERLKSIRQAVEMYLYERLPAFLDFKQHGRFRHFTLELQGNPGLHEGPRTEKFRLPEFDGDHGTLSHLLDWVQAAEHREAHRRLAELEKEHGRLSALYMGSVPDLLRQKLLREITGAENEIGRLRTVVAGGLAGELRAVSKQLVDLARRVGCARGAMQRESLEGKARALRQVLHSIECEFEAYTITGGKVRHRLARVKFVPLLGEEISMDVSHSPEGSRGPAHGRAGGRGKIVFISSCHVHTPYARSVAYNAGKGGLNLMAFTIAAELYQHRINVNVIEPGWIDTPGEHEAFGSDAIAKAGSTLPWGRLGVPEDIGKAAVFLCSDDADYITGTALAVDGGIWLRSAWE